MFKKKCKNTGCLFKLGRINRCSLDKKCYLLCKVQQRTKLMLRDLRIMIANQFFLETHPRSLSDYMNEEYCGL